MKIKDLKPGDSLFLVGSIMPDENIENSFSKFEVKSTLETLDGKRNTITCISGKIDDSIAYFTALSNEDINGIRVKIRIDKWSEKFTRTISDYRKFLSFSNNTEGLDFLERKFSEYIKNIKELRRNEI